MTIGLTIVIIIIKDKKETVRLLAILLLHCIKSNFKIKISKHTSNN